MKTDVKVQHVQNLIINENIQKIDKLGKIRSKFTLIFFINCYIYKRHFPKEAYNNSTYNNSSTTSK